MFKVDIEKCIGCGLCVSDCLIKDIEMNDGKANIKNKNCFKCGHCIAICPVKAVFTDEYNMDDIVEYDEKTCIIEPENLLNFIKYRRSIRKYKDKTIENDKIEKIIEAGRFTPTATNSQDVSYIVVKDRLQELKKLTMETLKNKGEQILSTSEDRKMKMYAKMWLDMYKKFNENPLEDKLFYNAPVVVVITAKNPVNADLASCSMEFMANTLGIGAVYCGFFIVASEKSEEIREFLEIPKDKKLVSCLVLGYPDIKYKRTTPRKTAEIIWK